MLHIVDDEEAIRDSLIWLAESRQIHAAGYDGAQPFLDMLGTDYAFNPEGDCLLLDMRMPDMSGALLFDTLAARGLTQRMPVIFLTGHGDVPMAVDSLKRGAFDFFEKPFNDNKLIDRVEEALQASLKAGDQALVQTRLASLSSREREVMDLILEGRMNKVIADMMGISMRTVEVHRAHILSKMQVRTAVELARLLK
ncbi:response regulator transcription factor [Castellaniella sp.]|uniref:response regulator transcription factor n=1 Tax=Castellaniella sp. TaxID=1955812 RepID=UPI002AFF297B|nr:response regulator [Castellaniella sp.]